ncbi:energy-coupling factor transporter transmembrane component T family protein [Weissella soli]|jgi:energy-coupling factor transport system permease protein|uniref:Energy-coupling factor transporter transmembrane protein EcfT n=1 Tax=Weissella soli TaxID=155866 RepID=A0A288QUR5_9LACO|nr:energy-coupling factor transporter transmembrane component T [Weissella soli]AOT55853.1 Energy-coupling factor transporter transmembrane protein EcfT [Weissella soli]MCT8394487.1 energy-coupling factor transporter transmembrane protein EcfT [Weissella soli]NKY83665.1 energy-coupling factor transporter transmembrane protein EcfT [Weissella soli]QEA35219.1 energy-coupling factor transporter transmembrane protein EcfT [Weissella soli]RDL06473.1 energy-coupling factor transport system permease 
MFNQILIGRYMPGDSWIHRLDARTKLIISVLFIFAIFSANNVAAYGIAALFTFGVILLTSLGLGVFIRGVRPMLFLMLFTVALQIFFTPMGQTIWAWHFIKITDLGVYNAAAVFIRFMLIIMFSTVLTLTTPPLEVADAMEAIMQPLKKIGVPVAELALMLSIALRFVPTLLDEAESIMNAQRARGVEFNEGSLIKRIKAYVPLLIPLFINAIKRAIELGDAMEARGYRGGDHRTKYRQLVWTRRDGIAFITFAVFTLALILTRII